MHWQHDDCEGEAVYCSEPPCEDFENVCACRDCGPHNYVNVQNMSSEYDGKYGFDYFSGFLEGNRPVFERNGKCVWWHRQYRHWWVGPCENVGLNAGYAYAEEDFSCPRGDQVWRRGGSNEIIHNAIAYFEIYAAAGGLEPDQSSSTAGVNAIIRNGRYKQTCRPVYRNGSFRCSKTAE